jgi:hypothetical protein
LIHEAKNAIRHFGPPRVEKNMNARPSSLLLATLCLAASGLLPGFAWGQSSSAQGTTALDTSPIGKVQTVIGIVRIEHSAAVVLQASLPPSGTDQAKAGDLVYRGDLIQTGEDGTLAVTFVDGTSFNVSHNARMAVDEFLYDPNSQSNSTLLTLTTGTFSFIAGKIAHTGSMQVATPVGTMGIRGTAPRVEIFKDGSVKFSTLVEEK